MLPIRLLPAIPTAHQQVIFATSGFQCPGQPSLVMALLLSLSRQPFLLVIHCLRTFYLLLEVNRVG